MRINQLLLESQLNESRNILRESCDGLDREQRRIVEGIYNEFVPLIEASLTADQIAQIFGTVEKSETDAGGNRTMLGKAADVPGQVNDVINNVGKWLQNTTPVKMADEKFEKLKNDINKKFPDSKLLDGISNLGIWMKENPGKSAAVIGVLTALASLAGGPVGGAIAGQVLRGAAELIKGEKLSTAVGKGIKTAALGYLSGKAFEVLGKFVSGMRADALPVPGAGDSGLAKVTYGATRTITAPGMSSSEMVQGFNVTVFPSDQEAINQAMQAIRDGQAGGFDTLRTIAREIQSADYKSAMKDILAGARAEQLSNDGLMTWINGMAKAGQALSQGAVAASTGTEKKESYYVQARPLSEGQVYLVFNRVVKLNEGPIWDKVKGAAGKAVDAVAQKAGQIGTNLTTKVTADKLNSAWKAAGSPMDSAEVEKILAAAGVSPEITTKVFTDLKIPVGGAAAAAGSVDIEQVKKMIAALPTDRKARLLKFLQKNITATPAQG